MSDDLNEQSILLIDDQSPVAASRCFRVSNARKVATSAFLPENELAVEIHYARWDGKPYPSPVYLVLDKQLAIQLAQGLIKHS